MEAFRPVQRRWTTLQRVILCGALALTCTGVPARAAQATDLGQGIASELQTLASHASMVFVGQITSIKRKGGVVEVTFRIEQPIAGAVSASYVVREWAGLWPPGQNRYTVGQRALAFLHAPSDAGLSSPVHGAEGLVPVVVQGAENPPLLDVRRVAAAVERSQSTPLPTEAEGGILLSDALTLISARPGMTQSGPVSRPLPAHGARPVGVPKTFKPGSPLPIPVQQSPRVRVNTPVRIGGALALR